MEKTVHASQQYWEYSNDEDLFFGLVGADYGVGETFNLNTMVQEKEKLARVILDCVCADEEKIGLELGSGSGILTRVAGSRSKEVIACDISESFLREAKRYCSGAKNIQFRQIQPGDLSFLAPSSLDYVFSNNVFIHLEFYEVFQYLKQVSVAMKANGLFWFDFAEIERLSVSTNPDFAGQLRSKQNDPRDKACIQFNSSVAIMNAAAECGFELLQLERADRCITQCLFRKN